ncbi:MAG: hypothetical protein Q9190_000868 [Brigantiaea leucoxantha]
MYKGVLLSLCLPIIATLAAFDIRPAAAQAAAVIGAQNSKFIDEYSAIIAAETTNSAFRAIATADSIGKIPVQVANAEEVAYIQAVATATTPVPLPSFFSSLPKDQQAVYSSVAQRIGKAAKAVVTGASSLRNATAGNSTSVNGTVSSNSTSSSKPKISTPPPLVPPSSSNPPPAPTTTDATGLGSPAQPTGVMKVAGAIAVGIMGAAALL